MSEYHKACKDCVLGGDCLHQDSNDVESCDIVQKYEIEKRKENPDVR